MNNAERREYHPEKHSYFSRERIGFSLMALALITIFSAPSFVLDRVEADGTSAHQIHIPHVMINGQITETVTPKATDTALPPPDDWLTPPPIATDTALPPPQQ